MKKTVKARYDAENNILRLVEPLEGVANDAEVEVDVATKATPEHGERPWAHLRGILSKESGEEMARIIDDEFPPTNDWSQFRR
jgi:hypothetical protein